MSRLEYIKNEIAKEGGYDSFIESLKDNSLNRSSVIADALNKIIDKACINYAKEVAQASLEKASENVTIDENFSEVNINHWVNKESITNPENIVLL